MARIIVIPARLASERFPGKLLAAQTGWPLIRHVHDRCARVAGVDRIVVAVADEPLASAVRSFGGEAIETPEELPSGTDRVAFAVERLGVDPDRDRVVNVQGDEPEIDPDHIERLFEMLEEPAAAGNAPAARVPAVATLATIRRDAEGFHDPNRVKVVVDQSGFALYFSRAPIPSSRAAAARDLPWLVHVGIYGFRPGALRAFARGRPGPLEERERLEQLRFLEMGFPIRVGVVDHASPGIDTPEDYRQFVERVGRDRYSGS